MTGSLSFGVAGFLDAETVRALAPHVEAAGFRSLWVNDTPQADALALLSIAAEVTSTIDLGAGVIALDRRPPASIVDDIAHAAIPEQRLVLGVGSGQRREGALALVRDGVAELRKRTAARVVVGALGPRMRALAYSSDGVLLNWVTPDAAADIAAEAAARCPVILYARTIAEDAARPRLEGEARRYGSFPQYAAHFARLGIDPMDTTIDLPGDPAALAAFAASVDELVLRAVTPTDALDEYLRFLDDPAVRALLPA